MALTADEIHANAQTQLTGHEDGLVACWPLDDGKGQNPRNLQPYRIRLTLGWTAAVDDGDPIWMEVTDPQAIRAADFDGDGTVGFQDFIQFAKRYGANEGDTNYDAAFDLDSDRKIGFTDFILFAKVYGQSTG